MNDTEIQEAFAALRNPVPESMLSYRFASWAENKEVSYVQAGICIDQLNQLFGERWEFRIISCDMVNLEDNTEVVVRGELNIFGHVRQAMGSNTPNRNRDGHLLDGALGDASKSAAGDSLKKCATLFGYALGLSIRTEKLGVRLSDPNHPENYKVKNQGEQQFSQSSNYSHQNPPPPQDDQQPHHESSGGQEGQEQPSRNPNDSVTDPQKNLLKKRMDFDNRYLGKNLIHEFFDLPSTNQTKKAAGVLIDTLNQMNGS